MRTGLCIALGLVLLSACAPAVPEHTQVADEPSTLAPGSELEIFVTTNYLEDAVRRIAPQARIYTMVGPGSDPHTFQPSTRDIQTMLHADLVVWNGLNLEAHLAPVIEELGPRQLALAQTLPEDTLIPLPDQPSTEVTVYDPHVWNDPKLWVRAIDNLAQELARLDPANARKYRQNASEYGTEILALHLEIEASFARLPAGRRVLISGHDAFAYLGRSYGLEVHATDFAAAQAALSPRQLSELADLIVKTKTPVIFDDNQSNPQAIRSLQEAVNARDWDVQISPLSLYADTLAAVPPADTYLGALLYNTQTIYQELLTR